MLTILTHLYSGGFREGGQASSAPIGREFSDHCLVLFHVLLVPAATQSQTRKIFLYNKGDYDQLRVTLSDFRCTFFQILTGS